MLNNSLIFDLMNIGINDIVWLYENQGAYAYVGKIKIGSYFLDTINPKEGKYRVRSLLPQSNLRISTDKVETAKELIERDLMEFLNKLCYYN